MLASFIIPFPAERIDNVLQTLRFLSKWHSDVINQSEVILMCQNRIGHINSDFKETTLINLELPFMQKSKLLNTAVEVAKSETVVFLDSDRILPPNYFKNTFSVLSKKTAITTKTMEWLTQAASDSEIESDNFKYINDHRSLDNKILTRNFFSGNVTMFKNDYMEIGGMDEGYQGYGFEDHDTTNLLIKNNIQLLWRDEIEIHLYHERLTYGTGDQKKMFLDNGLRYCRKWSIAIPEQLQKEINSYTQVII